MSESEEPRYESSEGYQQELVDHLLGKKKRTAVVKCDNSMVQAYLTREGVSRTELLNIDGERSPYEIDRVVPLPDSPEFACRVNFTARWKTVFDR